MHTRRTRTIARLAVVALVAAALATLAPQAAAPAAADPVQTASSSLAVGNGYSCALTPAGAVKCWGFNASGQLGNNSTANSSVPVTVSGLSSGVTAIATGTSHSCALTSAGAVSCWGLNTNGQLGNGSTTNSSVPVTVSGLSSGVTAIATGDAHSCALTSAGAAVCWGINGNGRLGNGSTTSSSVPVAVSGLSSGVTAIATGFSHSCALTSGGAVSCWGLNGGGQLGNNSTTQSSVPVAVSGLTSGVTAIAGGGAHSCALTSAGAAVCWGANSTGQLGNNSTANSSVPVAVSGLSSGVSAIAGGFNYSCALTSAGAVMCWGTNASGQLGNNSTANSSVPVAVSGLSSGVSAIATGNANQHSCALTSAGAATCWGLNTTGQLGNNVTTQSLVPVAVSGLSSGVSAIATGTSHSCALTSAGAVSCWGLNTSGQLGNNSTTSSSVPVPVPVPVAVSGLSSGVSAIATGANDSCAVTSAGAAVCWGSNNAGQLGNNSTTNSSVPVAVSGLSSGVTAIAGGSSHSCALTSAGAVMCWGLNSSGQLGDNSFANSLVPLAVSELSSGVIAIATGSSHSCALTSAGAVMCWGLNTNGQLGNNSTANSPVPVAVSGLSSGVTAIAGGNAHSCASTSAGAVKCWGTNSSGQLGNNSTTQSLVPVGVSGLSSGAIAIATGSSHSCASTSAGAVSCWGNNGNGRLGNNSTNQSAVPVAVSGLTSGVTAIATGGTHSCAVTSAGAVSCWGNNANGQLGSPPPTASPSEVSGGLTFGPLAPALTVVKTVDETSVVAGATVHLHVKVTNTGNVALTNVTITDANATSCQAAPFSLAVGANTTVDCTHVATAGEVAGGYHNTASVVSTEVTTPVVSNEVTVTVTPAPAPALSVVASADETSVVAGDTVHLHVKVENTGNVALTNVTITDANGPDCEAAPFSLALGASNRVDCEYVATADDVPAYKNKASVTSTEVTTPVVSNEVEVAVTAAAPGLSVVVSADEASVSPGQVIHSHVVVSNTGNVGLHNVTVSDTKVPDCANDGVFDLAVDAFVTIDCSYTTTGNDAGTFEHEVSVTADEVTTPVVSNQVDVTVDDAITVVMTANKTTVAVGSPVVFTIKVKNTSSLQLRTPTVVDDAVPDCVSAPVGAFLQPGQEHTVTCTLVPTAADIGTFSNTATADSSQIVAVVSNEVDVTVVAAAPALTVTQTADQSEVVAGDPIDVTVTVTNTGNVDLHGVMVTDPAAPGCEDGPFPLVVGDAYEISCTHVSTGADVPTYENRARVSATEVPTPVVSNTVSVDVTVPSGAAHVSGFVTETGSGVPVAGAVAVLLSPADFSPVAVGTADAAGHFGALAAPGNYYVYVVDPADGHAAGFHGAPSPSPVAAVADATTNADTSLAPTRGVISGAATADGTGDPLAGVLAMSVDLDAGGPGAGDLTGADGAYAVSGLRAGPRLVEFVDLTGGHRPEFFDDAPTPAGSSIISVVAASVTTADAGLAAQAAPSGGSHLVGEVTSSTGESLEGVAVMAVHTADFSLAAGDLTDASGHYDIEVDAGGYTLAFYDPTGGHRFEWFDDQGPDGLADAATVTATAGTPLGTDAALTPTTGAATGTVTESGTSDRLGSVAVFAIDSTGAVVGVTQVAPDGSYTLAGLPPGAHRLRFIDLTGSHTSEYFDDSPDYAGGTPVTITAGTTTPNVDGALAPTG